jgi:phage terminase large subunit-like protein
MGMVMMEPGADIAEFLSFPAGKHDDEVDVASLIGRALDQVHRAIVPATIKVKDPSDAYRRASNSGGSGWKTL